MNPYRSYSLKQLENENPAEQIASLFTKAAEHISQAGIAIDHNDIAKRFEYSQKACTILEGLMGCLNRDTPERQEIAGSLELYYKSMIYMISRMNILNDNKICQSLEVSFTDMAKFWRDAGKKLAEQSPNPNEKQHQAQHGI